jgi:hypothetical protein
VECIKKPHFKTPASLQRSFAVATGVLISSSCFLFAQPTFADEIKGTVFLSANAKPVFNEKSALYLTAREDFGVLGTILQQRPPPVFSKKLTQLKEFPASVELSDVADLTVEGGLSSSWKSGKKNLVISARWDTDGDASTRGEDDLVGKGSSSKGEKEWSDFSIELEGRGVAGKFLTKKTLTLTP